MDDLQWRGTAAELSSLSPADGARRLQALPSSETAALLLSLPANKAASLLERLPEDLAAAATMAMKPADAARIVQEMESDEEADLLQEVTPEHSEAILGLVDADDASVARELLSHDEDSAGGLMQVECITVPSSMQARHVVQKLRAQAKTFASYPASYLYVVDDGGRLEGVLSLRDLILCEGAERVAEIKSKDVITLPPDMPGEQVVKMFQRLRYLALPVVDDERRLLGIVTQHDVLEYAEEEADEEMLRFAGIVSGDEFRDQPIRRRSWRRLSWLSINILLNVMAASVIAMYQETLQAVIALAVFLPIISDMSGCSGSQAVAVSIRELSLERITPRNVLWVLWKETSVGLMNGLVLGVIIGLVCWLWKSSLLLGAVVGGALLLNTIIAVAIGGAVPLLLKRFRMDPAIASGPILTTSTDVCGFLLVLGLATRVLDKLPPA